MKKLKDLINQRRLNKRESKAKEILSNPEKIDEFLRKVDNKKTFFLSSRSKEILSNIPDFIELIKSYIKNEYKVVPTKTIISIICALIYFISPIDAITDIIPILGLIDDFSVLGFCLKSVEEDVNKYRNWKLENKEK